jgi:PhoH-like ATPase
MKKTYVLDTNVILYDPTSIFNFGRHDVVIPIIVLEELDKFKRGNDIININARHFIRDLDKLSNKVSKKVSKKVSQDDTKKVYMDMALGRGKGQLFITIENFDVPKGFEVLEHKKNDNLILYHAANLLAQKKETILVTKDINLRMKAKSLNIPVQDYELEAIKTMTELYKGYRVIDNLTSEYIDSVYENPENIKLPNDLKNPLANEYFLLKNGKQSALVRYDGYKKTFVRVLEQHVSGLKPRNLEQILAIDCLLNTESSLVTLTGTPGSGKTLLALASAIQQRRLFAQILLSRPLIPLSNKDIGFLPGDVDSKINPYMQPLWDNLKYIKGNIDNDGKIIDAMLQSEKIDIAPLTYIRGRSLPKVYFLIDEAQNLTPHEIKTIITRAGENTKIVFTGDIYQIEISRISC